jgi:uncharacterized protein with NRDE domain
MCLILFAYRSHPRYPLILGANRDEFYERPTAPASFWENESDILAGRDLKNGGTWLGVTKSGRMAAITNYRDPSTLKEDAPSRGILVGGFLRGDESPEEYTRRIRPDTDRYNSFNLILGDGKALFFFASTTGAFVEILPGVRGISNHLLDTPWPKVERGKKLLKDLTSDRRDFSTEKIFDILADTSRPGDRDLPDTGVGIDWERVLSPVFIRSDVYGTRSSTVILIDREGNVRFIERSFSPGAATYKTKRFELRIPTGAYTSSD